MWKLVKISIIFNALLISAMIVNVTGCGGGGGGGSSGDSSEKIGLINLEINHPNPAIQVSQIYFNGTVNTSGPFPCQVTNPIARDNVFSCESAVYDANFAEITANVTIEGVPSEMILDMSSPPDIYVDVNELGDNFEYWYGGGGAVDTRLFARSHMNPSGIQSTTFVLINPEPGFGTATLSGPGLASPVQLWNGNYADVYRSYLQFSLIDYVPQLTGVYFAYNSYDNNVLAVDQRLPAGQYTVTLSNHSGSSAAQSYGVSYTRLDASALFPSMGLPPARSDIIISDSVTADQSVATADLASPLAVADGPYSISWVSEVVSPTEVRWQIMFNLVDSNGVPDNHLQVRTPRLSLYSGDLSYNSANTTWTWSPGTQQAQIEPGSVVRVQLRVTDSSNTARAHAQAFYLTRN